MAIDLCAPFLDGDQPKWNYGIAQHFGVHLTPPMPLVTVEQFGAFQVFEHRCLRATAVALSNLPPLAMSTAQPGRSAIEELLPEVVMQLVVLT